MVKGKSDKGMSLFKKEVPKMPKGYYSGDKPNPNLRAFVEQHVKKRPYDPETDDYDVPAFDKPIETTKATAIYNMHTYWSKKPHDAIRQYIRHYTKPDDLVLDPFCGSGGTARKAAPHTGPGPLARFRVERACPTLRRIGSARTPLPIRARMIEDENARGSKNGKAEIG